ncbi:type II secretion system protein GspM [Klebsiella sp. R445]
MVDVRALWQQRTRREQGLLIGMGVLLLAGTIWSAIWQPWLNREAQWQQTLAKEQASLRWMQQQTPRLQQLARQQPAAPATATREELSAIVMREASRQALTIVRLQPQGARVNVTLQPCTFQALLAWLDLISHQGILAPTLAVSADPARPGWVTVNTLILERQHEQ